MKRSPNTILVTHDQGLLAHWKTALGTSRQTVTPQIEGFLELRPLGQTVVWLDLSISRRPDWSAASWLPTLQSDHVRVIAASSNPTDEEGMVALNAGCSAYCHAFSNAATLKQVREVVHAGNVWIGKSLMQRMLRSVSSVKPAPVAPADDWSAGLTLREVEVATLAANGASNLAIASQCKISERTVKAHLSAVFYKLNITDRLQLALRVHGIH